MFTLRRALFVAVAALAGAGGLLAGAQVSYGLWMASLSVRPGVVQAADFIVTVTDSRGQAQPLTSAEGLPNAIILPAMDGLLPGNSVDSRLLLSNATQAGGAFTVSVGPSGLASILDNGNGLGHYLEISAAMGEAGDLLASCATIPSGEYMALWSAGSGTQVPQLRRSLPKNESAALCVRVSLVAGAPSSLSGTGAEITLPLAAVQEAA